MYKKNIDKLTVSLLEYIKNQEEGKTVVEIMSDLGIKHPQQLYNRLEKLIKGGYIDEDYKYITGIDTPTLYFPFFGWAQCGHNGKTGIVEDYPMKKIDISSINVKGLNKKDYKKFFITRAKGKSMEPEIKSRDNLLIRKFDYKDIYEHKNYLISHNGKAKIKKVYKYDNYYKLISLNPEYPDMIVNKNDEFYIIGEVERKITI